MIIQFKVTEIIGKESKIHGNFEQYEDAEDYIKTYKTDFPSIFTIQKVYIQLGKNNKKRK